MAKLVWDKTGERYYETGNKMAVLYPMADDGTYPKGVAWNGITGITESPSGADANPQYADDIKYLNLISAEEYGATVEGFTYPKEFEACDGSATIADGVTIGQQRRQKFGLCYRSTIGNDVSGTDLGYKLHIIYGATASPSDRGYQTINDSPEAMTMSWELTTEPVSVSGYKPTSQLTIDSRYTPADKLAALEAILYGTDGSGEGSDGTTARLPLPDEIMTLVGTASSGL